MPDGGEQFTLPVVTHPSGLWIGIDVIISDTIAALMVLDSGSPQSVISPRLRQDLESNGLLETSPGSGLYSLRLTAQRHELPRVAVRVLPRLARLAIDGLLGLDFLRSFELVCFRLSTSELLLEYASPSGPQ